MFKNNNTKCFSDVTVSTVKMLRLIRTRPFARNVTYRKREFVPLGRSVKAIESYKLGQHFIHNQLNYRGLILFSIPHERYVYDVETKDYTIHDEVLDYNN